MRKATLSFGGFLSPETAKALVALLLQHGVGIATEWCRDDVDALCVDFDLDSETDWFTYLSNCAGHQSDDASEVIIAEEDDGPLANRRGINAVAQFLMDREIPCRIYDEMPTGCVLVYFDGKEEHGGFPCSREGQPQIDILPKRKGEDDEAWEAEVLDRARRARMAADAVIPPLRMLKLT